MTDDNRKAPFSGAGDEEEWDKALNAWEVPDGARPDAKGEGTGAKAAKLPPVAPPKKAPLYRPQPPAAPTPPPSPREDKPAVNFERDDDDQDEATLVAQIPPELLRRAAARRNAKAPKGRGSGVSSRCSASALPRRRHRRHRPQKPEVWTRSGLALRGTAERSDRGARRAVGRLRRRP
jgi:hypothetical protein